MQDTAAFRVLGEIIHHLDDITAQLNGISAHLTQTAEEVAVLHSKVRDVETRLGALSPGLREVVESNAKILEDLRKRLG